MHRSDKDAPDTFDDVRRVTQRIRREDFESFEAWDAAVKAALHPLNRELVGGLAFSESRHKKRCPP